MSWACDITMVQKYPTRRSGASGAAMGVRPFEDKYIIFCIRVSLISK